MKHHTLGLIALASDGMVGVFQSGQLLSVALALALEFFGNLLLQHKCLEGVVSLLLGSRETHGEAGSVVLLLIDEGCKAAILALVGLDLGLEVLSLLGELLGKGLELEELLLPA